ncbi:hypothetical protein ACLM5J_02240 [Nocardioides sp. Bht2]|uniref:hypothetical protein n=1 Tax=Nocardioides sp. Bht2 TaxID=3392297 RepID=UPI0039B6CACF
MTQSSAPTQPGEPEATSAPAPDASSPVPPAVGDGAARSDFSRFGPEFMRLILHKERVTQSIDRVLGDSFALGPIGAGPGRKFAKATATGTYKPSYGHPLEGEIPGYQIFVPVSVVFDLHLSVDSMRFMADVVLPLEVRMHLEDPLTIVWDIRPPTEQEISLQVRTDKVRSAVLQRVSGLDGELRRFIMRFVARELDKPHVQRARRIKLVELIDAAWPVIAAQFLPNSAEDRIDPRPASELELVDPSGEASP